MIKKILSERNLPDFKSREEMLDILQKEEYGYLPQKPEKITWKTTENFVPKFCASKADFSKIDLTCTLNVGFHIPRIFGYPDKRGQASVFYSHQFQTRRARQIYADRGAR